jgi:hypothetical protein
MRPLALALQRSLPHTVEGGAVGIVRRSGEIFIHWSARSPKYLVCIPFWAASKANRIGICLICSTMQKGVQAVAEAVDQQKQRYREFLDLLPLTLELAGLPKSEHGRYYTEEQIEARLFTIRHALKAARLVAREVVNR